MNRILAPATRTFPLRRGLSSQTDCRERPTGSRRPDHMEWIRPCPRSGPCTAAAHLSQGCSRNGVAAGPPIGRRPGKRPPDHHPHAIHGREAESAIAAAEPQAHDPMPGAPIDPAWGSQRPRPKIARAAADPFLTVGAAPRVTGYSEELHRAWRPTSIPEVLVDQFAPR